MRSRVLLAAAAGLLVLACSAKKEKTELEGAWAVASADKDTKLAKGPTKEDFAKTKFVFSGDKFRMESGEKKNEGTFKLDSSKNPKEIDLLASRTMKGIYKLDGSELTLCLGPPEGHRPAQFSAKPGTGATLLTLKPE